MIIYAFFFRIFIVNIVYYLFMIKRSVKYFESVYCEKHCISKVEIPVQTSEIGLNKAVKPLLENKSDTLSKM